jgi:hypothetical protein
MTSDGNAVGTVDQEVGDDGGQDFGFLLGIVEVGFEVDGLLIDVFHEGRADFGEAAFGVAHGGGGIAIDAAEVALTIDQGVAQAEGLRHADQGVVDGAVAMGVILAEHVTNDTGAFTGGPIEAQAHFVHREEDAAMDGLQAVADIGQGAANDDAHGVIEIATPHLILDVDRDVIFRIFA